MIQPWPALSSQAELKEGGLHYSRGVHGKVHRAASDYRWIAATPDIEPIGTEILRATAFGTEDQPREVFAWVPLGNSYLTVHAYPSRARDAAGRPGGIEKQILRWMPGDSGIPPALAAFFLLEVARSFDDSIWWGSWDSSDWRRREFVLPLNEAACKPVRWHADRLQNLIDGGIAALRAVKEDALARFYQSVLDERTPALLKVESGSLPWAAVAALLLPLPADIAARTSLCGGLPANDVRRDMLRNWSGVVCDVSAASSEGEPGMAARSVARALLSGDPALIDTKTGGHHEMSASAKYLSIFLVSSNRNLADPPADHDWEPIRSTELESLVGEIRRLDDEAQSPQIFAGDPERQSARQRHLRLKADLARSWLYACAPDGRVLQELPPREDAIPPALWFAAMAPSSYRLRERYDPAAFAMLVEHSLKPQRRHDRVLNWLAAIGSNQGASV